MSATMMPPGGPPPLPPIPGLIPQGMRPMGMQLGSEQMLAFLLPPKTDTSAPVENSDDHLPAALRPYAAGLRPASSRPARRGSRRSSSSGWQDGRRDRGGRAVLLPSGAEL